MTDEITLEWGMKYDDWLQQAWGLARAHWFDGNAFSDVLQLNPDHERYRAMEKAGMLHILTARVDGTLAGYLSVLIAPHRLDRNALIASDDVFYVSPKFRRLHIGRKMLTEAIRFLEGRGVTALLFREHAGRAEPGYLARYGFRPIEMVYAKLLRQPDEKGAAA